MTALQKIPELPTQLRPSLTLQDLSKEEQSDWEAIGDQTDPAQTAFLLFVNQRRSMRAWSVGCAVAAGSLGILTGYLAWGRK